MLERQHLILLQTIEQEGTVTKAAKELYLTQSALSHSMKKLEKMLDLQLWRKSGRNLVLTKEGRQLLQGANKLLPQFDKLEAEMRKLSSGELGILNIGIECYPCFQWLLKVVGPFLKEYPDIDVDIKNEFQFGGIGALLNFEIDLLLTPDPLFQDNLLYVPVFEYEQVLLVHESHTLAIKPFAAAEDLQQEVLYTFPVEQERLDVFTQLLQPNNARVKQHKTMENLEMIVEMVRGGRGVAAVPNWLVAESNVSGVKAVKLGAEGIVKTTYVALRANEVMPAQTERFLKMCRLQ